MKLLTTFIIASIFLASAVSLAADKPTSSAKPNIVFFLANDLGQRDLGCYGSTFYETPNLDRMAKDGALFTDAYAACPVCSPTRASLMTGHWPQRSGVTDYIGAPAKPEGWNRNTKMLPAPYTHALQLELQAWQKEVGAKMPSINRKFDPSKTNGRFAARKLD